MSTDMTDRCGCRINTVFRLHKEKCCCFECSVRLAKDCINTSSFAFPGDVVFTSSLQHALSFNFTLLCTFYFHLMFIYR